MLSNIKSTLSRNLTNALGWKTNRKIIVIESDDWGSIRMPNQKVRENFIKKGYDLGNNPYCKYDTLANTDDLNALFDVLTKFKSDSGHHPKITFNTVVANPDFEKIRASNFKEYSYEPFTTILKNYYPKEDVFGLWQEGIEACFIKPQFHGREHVNVPKWLEELRKQNKPILDAFNYSFWGLPYDIYQPNSLNIQASYDSENKKDTEFYKDSISEGLELFETIFKFRSKSFIANNYVWASELNYTLKENGVDYLQGMKYQKFPIVNPNKTRAKKSLYTGLINTNHQIHLVRNCVFEPSQYPNQDNVSKCMSQINQAFVFNKPAIITMHRLNFIGALSEKNRNQNHQDLKSLLSKIIQKWPDVEFMASDELGDLIKENKNK